MVRRLAGRTDCVLLGDDLNVDFRENCKGDDFVGPCVPAMAALHARAQRIASWARELGLRVATTFSNIAQSRHGRRGQRDTSLDHVHMFCQLVRGFRSRIPETPATMHRLATSA